MEKKVSTVKMTAEEAKEFAAFKAAQQKKAEAEKKRRDREAYSQLVDDAINASMPKLQAISDDIALRKREVIDQFSRALELKGEIYGVKDAQRSHTFTNSEGTSRITLGYYCVDDYRDTVEEGIAMVREAIESLGKDEESRALVAAVLRLLSRDQKGTLKASRVLQLRKLAEDSHNERFIEGVHIIEESYQPAISKQYVRAEIKGKDNQWVTIPLGMTEAK